jgi:hypothetical protein
MKDQHHTYMLTAMCLRTPNERDAGGFALHIPSKAAITQLGLPPALGGRVYHLQGVGLCADNEEVHISVGYFTGEVASTSGLVLSAKLRHRGPRRISLTALAPLAGPASGTPHCGALDKHLPLD